MPKLTNTERQNRKLAFFEKHMLEGKNVSQCSEELDVSRVTLHKYKKEEDFRMLAIQHLDTNKTGGLEGNMKRLADALDAEQPVSKETVNKDGTTSVELEFVPDNKTRLTAVKEVNKIYGIHAPVKQQIETRISLSSDAELFEAIDEAERACSIIDTYEEREGSFELVDREQNSDRGNFDSRERTVLQDGPVPESEQ